MTTASHGDLIHHAFVTLNQVLIKHFDDVEQILQSIEAQQPNSGSTLRFQTIPQRDFIASIAKQMQNGPFRDA